MQRKELNSNSLTTSTLPGTKLRTLAIDRVEVFFFIGKKYVNEDFFSKDGWSEVEKKLPDEKFGWFGWKFARPDYVTRNRPI